MTRVALCGGPELARAASILDLTVGEPSPDLVFVDLRDPSALASAALIPLSVPRIVIAGDGQRELVSALGIAAERVAGDAEASSLGPLVRALIPERVRPATRTVVITGIRGGTGRTLLATNLAARIARRLPVWLVDATGSGACGWWLRVEPHSWSELDSLGAELSAEQLMLVAAAPLPDLRVVGGGPRAPRGATVGAVLDAIGTLGEVAIVDAPPLAEPLSRTLCARADRVLLVSYDDPASTSLLNAEGPDPSWWLIASQSRAARIAGVSPFRALPRDERAVELAIGARDLAGGSLGRAYDDLAELLSIDAS
ncbi:MAG: hypothetical protein HY071_04940 [Chloroflexi bacterium]|nr:hypothetical protein [Chloroflexota bacterium]